MLTDRQIQIQTINSIHDEAIRLINKYKGSAALKALYRAQAPDDFYDQVSNRILYLERMGA